MIIGEYIGIESPYLVDSNSEDLLLVRLPVIIQFSQHLLVEIGTQTGYRHGIIGVVQVWSRRRHMGFTGIGSDLLASKDLIRFPILTPPYT